MSKQTINIGASPNDGTGTPLRTSFDYTNQNFTELYTALGGGVGLPGATTQVIFNDGGTNLAGDAGLVYNKTTDALTIAGLVTAGSATITGALTVDTTTLVVDATNDMVGVGTAPSYKFHAVATSGAVGAFRASTAAIARLLVGNTVGDLEIKVNANSDGQITSDAGKYLGLGSNTSNDRVILDTSGNLSITNGNVVMATSGKGIDFSAVTGGTGTATANVLNDYEEGTWVPGVSFGGGVTGIVYSENSGKYTKIGRQVTVSAFIDFTNKGSSTGNVLITGLPFTIGAANSNYTAASLVIVRITFADYPMAFGTPSATSLEVQEVTNAGVRTNLTDADFANNSQIILGFTYTV